MPMEIKLNKSFISALLGSLFFLAFFITDYWNIPNNPIMKVIFLASTLILGITWCFLASSDVNIKTGLINWFPFFLLIVGIIILNYRALHSVIPWRGDEDYHIRTTLNLVNQIRLKALLLVLSCWVLMLFLFWRKSRWAIFASAIFFLGLFFAYPSQAQFANLRYPFVNYWFFTLLPKLVKISLGSYHEILFRIVPLLSVIGLAGYFQHSLANKNKIESLLWGFSVATLPLVFYYSSLLYLDMPAILLMTIVCLRINHLFTVDFVAIKKDIGWYALILMGFIKETTFPFLICFLICRTVIQIQQKIKDPNQKKKSITPTHFFQNKYLGNIFKQELWIYFVSLLPVIYYLLFRTVFSTARGYVPELSNLIDISLLMILAYSFFEQFGVFLLLFFGGCALYIFYKNYSTIIFFLMLMISYALFYLMDNYVYAGYSRFNLYFLPPILASSCFFIKHLISRNKTISTVLAIIIILSSLVLSPIQKDGTKLPFWGNYLIDTSEHYYPVDEAIAYLKNSKIYNKILISGLDYPYFFDFYFKKFDWYPSQFEVLFVDRKKQPVDNLNAALVKAEKGGFDNVLFFVLGKAEPVIPKNNQYEKIMEFNNLSHHLVLYGLKN